MYLVFRIFILLQRMHKKYPTKIVFVWEWVSHHKGPRIWGDEALGSLDAPPHLWAPTDAGQAASLAREGGTETVLGPRGHLQMHAHKIILRKMY